MGAALAATRYSDNNVATIGAHAMGPSDIIDFWFYETSADHWWTSNPAFDSELHTRFASLHAAASAGELQQWRTGAAGRLAEIIILDQFSRNLYRGSARAFAQDGMALVLAQEAVAQGLDHELPPVQRSFLYMPFMHSESRLMHLRAVELFSAPELEANLAFELKHKAIIDRFGRYPHRNAALGRRSTVEELLFLEQPGSSF